MASRFGIWGALVLALAVIALAACGDDDDSGGESDVSAAELAGGLPSAEELGLEERGEWEFEDATDFVADGLVVGAATDPDELGATIEDAGFQAAAGTDLGGKESNVRIRAAQFESEDGALEVRGLLHEEDLKTPCPDACIVTPVEYKLDDIPDSAAVHHVPTKGEVPPGASAVEAHHAEFVIGSQLYVVQVDGRPSPTFSEDFDELMTNVYAAASGAG